MAFVRARSDTDIVRVELSPEGKMLESKGVLAESTSNEASPKVSPDGRRIVFLSHRSGSNEIWTGDSADGGNLLRLTTFNGPHTGSPRWSPDGRTIVFDSRTGANPDIYTVPSGGGAVQRLTTEPSTEARASFSPDGRWIYFRSNASGSRRYYRMPFAAGPNPPASWQPVSAEDAQEGYPSADGRMFYYVYPSIAGIYSVPAEGGAERRVTDEGVMSLWTVAGDFIYYIGEPDAAARPVWKLEPATGKKVRIGSITDRVYADSGELSVSPDFRFLLYTRYEPGGADLVLVENFR